MRPIRAVFDTNIVISALVFGGRLTWLRHVWITTCKPVICTETAQELIQVLGYPKFRLDASKQRTVLDAYIPFAEFLVLPDVLPTPPPACWDRKDLMFLHLALTANCPLVSGDADIAVLKDVMPVPILSPSDLESMMPAA